MRKQEFTEIKNKLIGIARSCGAEVKIVRKEFQRGQKFGAFGYYNIQTRTVGVQLRGNCSYLQILAALAYGVKHADNHDHGNFPGVYNQEVMTKEYAELVKNGEVIPPSVEEAMASEESCNLFVRSFLENERVPLPEGAVTYMPYFRPVTQYDVGYFLRLNQLAPRGPRPQEM